MLALAAHVAVVGGGGATAGAQEESFGAGSGAASAKYLRVGPSRGSLSLAPYVGLAMSDFSNTLGRGDVRMVDIGILGEFLPKELTSAMPTLKVTSAEGGSEQGRTTTLGAPPEVPVGASAAQLYAQAGDEPYGKSSFRTAPVDLGAVSIGAGTAETFSGVVDGRMREALGRVQIGNIDIGAGALVLEGLVWEALHRTGGETAGTGTFTVGAVSVAGQRFGAPEGAEQPLADAIAAAEPALRLLGVDIQLPTARIEKDIVEMTPLRIRVADSEIGAGLAPVVGGVQPAREALVNAIRAGTEDVDVALLVADVVLGVVTGGSKLDIEIGGATARTAEPAEAFSFGSGAGGFDLSAGGALGAALPTVLGGGSGAGNIKVPAALGLSPSATPSGAKPSAAASPKSAVTETVPVSAPGGGDGGAGPLLPIGLAGLGAALAAGSVDYRRLLRMPVPA